MKQRLCVDIDNVIAHTDKVMLAVICRETDGRVNLRYQDIKTFKYQHCTDPNGQSITEDEWHQIHDRFSDAENLLSIQPFEEVQERLAVLSQRFAIQLATSRLPKARRATIDWLESNGFDFKYDLHFLSHGEKHLSLGTFAAAVEDDLDQAQAFATNGIESYVMNHPWNQCDQPNPRLHRTENWAALTPRLLAFP